MGRIVSQVFRGRDAATVTAMYHAACDMLEGCYPRAAAVLEEAESRLEAMALTWSFESLPTPIFSATLRTLRVLVPVAYISATAATRAQSTRW